jgi:hypothetical protein
MVSIYLSTRMDCEYLEYLSERYGQKFNYESFDWCRLENPETGMKLPSRRDLDETLKYLGFFLAPFRESLSVEELGKVTYFESSLERWRSNAHFLYSRALDFVVSAVSLYYEVPLYPKNRNSEDTPLYSKQSIKGLFEEFEGLLLELLRDGENPYLMDSLLELMETVSLFYESLEPHMSNAAIQSLRELQDIAAAFEVERLLSSRL